MQILVNNDFNSAGVQFTAGQIASFLQDEQTAINILNTTFTSNITVTFNVGFGSSRGQPLPNQNVASASPNTLAAVTETYSQLREQLLTLGQPNFFTTTNLPAGKLPTPENCQSVPTGPVKIQSSRPQTPRRMQTALTTQQPARRQRTAPAQVQMDAPQDVSTSETKSKGSKPKLTHDGSGSPLAPGSSLTISDDACSGLVSLTLG
jgi:hypothetical protein